MRLKSLIRQYIISGSSILARSNASLVMTQGQTALVTPTYGANVTIDAALGDFFIISVSNNSAFTVLAPTNTPQSGFSKYISITIANGSGGAMGAITWTAGAGGFRLAGAFTNPANATQRSIIFRWNGTVWHEVARTAADVTTA